MHEKVLRKSIYGIMLGIILLVAVSAPVLQSKVWAVVNEGKSFDLKTSLSNGSIQKIELDKDFTSIVLTVSTTDKDGALTITLPRDLIDAQTPNGMDDKFTVLVNGDEIEATEIDATTTERTLSIPVKAGAEKVEIIGTMVFGVEPVRPVEIPSGQNNIGNLVVIFISNLAGKEGCSDDDWKFAYEMGNLGWIYLAQYQIPTTLEVKCQGIDDFNSYHPTGLITMYLLDEEQSIPIKGIQYDRDHLTASIKGKQVPIHGVAFLDKKNGETAYIATYAVESSEYYNIDPEQTAWTISHELSHISLHLLGYQQDIYEKWVHHEQALCDSGKCESERIFVGNFVWNDVQGVWYDVMKHYSD